MSWQNSFCGYCYQQKEHRAAVANDLIQTSTNETDFLKKVVTGDEWWVYGNDLEMKVHSSQWKLTGSPCPRKAWQSFSKIKTMLTVLLIEKVLSITSMPLQDKQLIRKTTSVFSINWEMQYNKKGCSYGQLVIGSFIMTTLPLMHDVS